MLAFVLFFVTSELLCQLVVCRGGGSQTSELATFFATKLSPRALPSVHVSLARVAIRQKAGRKF